jgi:CBS domain-containing protein
MKVRDVMHKGALCVEASQPIAAVAKTMRDADVGAIPVRRDGAVVGIVTDRDLACRALAGRRRVSALTAKDVMSRKVASCRPDDDLDDAVKTMAARKVRRLPVVDRSRKLVGMLSLGDISHASGKKLSAEALRAVSAHHA